MSIVRNIIREVSTECTSEISFCRTSRWSENPRWEPYYIGKIEGRGFAFNKQRGAKLRITTRKCENGTSSWSQERQTISLEKSSGWRLALATRVAARIRNRKSIFTKWKRNQGIQVDFKYKCTSIQMNKSSVAIKNFIIQEDTWRQVSMCLIIL